MQIGPVEYRGSKRQLCELLALAALVVGEESEARFRTPLVQHHPRGRSSVEPNRGEGEGVGVCPLHREGFGKPELEHWPGVISESGVHRALVASAPTIPHLCSTATPGIFQPEVGRSADNSRSLLIFRKF